MLRRYGQLRVLSNQLRSLQTLQTQTADADAFQPEIKFAKLRQPERCLDVQWDDGCSGTFPFVWLRDNCPEPHTYRLTDISKSRLLQMNKLDLNIEPKKMEFTADDVKITWENLPPAQYTSDWLRQRNLADTAVLEKRKKVLMYEPEIWDSERLEKNIRRFDFNQFLNDEITQYEALTALRKWGLVIFNNTQQQRGEIFKLENVLGYSKAGHYGKSFFVKTVSNPNNPALTDDQLELHTDQTYLENPSDIQVLHCLVSQGTDGKNKFCDGFKIAEVMKRDMPDLFELLQNYKLEYWDEGEDYIPFETCAKKYVFDYDEDGNLQRVNFANHHRTWFIDAPDVPLMYKALRAFDDLAGSDHLCYQHLLRSGEMFVFDNTRVLHGRGPLTGGAEKRRELEGIYFNWDVVKSRIRHLRRKYDLGPSEVSY